MDIFIGVMLVVNIILALRIKNYHAVLGWLLSSYYFYEILGLI